MLIAWTTVSTADEANRLAAEIIRRGLAVCVQVEGPVVAHYRWDAKVMRAEETRLAIKLTASQLPALQDYVLTTHPYDTPEWLVVRAEHVGEKYLSWANATVHSPPL